MSLMEVFSTTLKPKTVTGRLSLITLFLMANEQGFVGTTSCYRQNLLRYAYY